ncbi:MAG: OsmC family protein [Thermoplasmatota archaeon]
MGWEPVKYLYQTSLKWTGEHKGLLSCGGKPDIEVACPPEWGGHAGIWSPEDLFVASLEVCTLTTFLFLIERMRGRILSYESTAAGTAQIVEGTFVFKDVVIRPKVRVPSEEDLDRASKAFGDCARWCLVTKSVRCEVRVEPEVAIERPRA